MKQSLYIAIKALLCSGLVLLLLTGCGNKIKGEYISDHGWVDKLDFKAKNKVEITNNDIVMEGIYEVEDNKVKVTAGGDTAILHIRDNGCLDGGDFLGIYCKKK